MNAKTHFQKHFAKLRSEALIRSLLAALVIGFVVGFAAAIVTWIVNVNAFWVPMVAIVAATAISTPIFYIKKYRPTAIRSARRIDRLGLEERLITMVEYQQDESCMAAKQREDAKQKLAELETTELKLRVPRNTLATLAVSGVFGIGMTVVTTLAALGLLPTGLDLWEDMYPEDPIKYVSVTYEVYEGGYIDGEADQLIPMGSNASGVVAVADDGWQFDGWIDGHTKPDRTDSNVEEDVVYVAIFVPLDGQPSEGDPSEEQQEQQEQQDQQENSENQNPQEQDPDSPPSPAGGGKYEEYNQIIDGETYYKEVLESYRELLAERLETEGSEMTAEERAIIEAYLGIV